ncbi:MAG: SH3 domain-containing protein [Fusobacteriaceae bacterium]|nr:SH3 domain-containing protein [Fusobacteriaceae bacterium]MBN2838686.1 SH3 domain-containing protein [Fusobacteriaceae bacterium]
MFKFLNFLCILLIISTTLFGKGYKEGNTLYVWARNGMNLREEPSPTGKVIRLLPMGAEVIVKNQVTKISYNYSFINKSNEGYEGDDIILHGYWLKVEVDGVEGYVFSKLLLPMKVERNEYGIIDNMIYYLKLGLKSKKTNDKKEDEIGYTENCYFSDKFGKNKSYIYFSIEEAADYTLQKYEIRNLNFEELVVYFFNVYNGWEYPSDILLYKEGEKFEFGNVCYGFVYIDKKKDYMVIKIETGFP